MNFFMSWRVLMPVCPRDNRKGSKLEEVALRSYGVSGGFQALTWAGQSPEKPGLNSLLGRKLDLETSLLTWLIIWLGDWSSLCWDPGICTVWWLEVIRSYLVLSAGPNVAIRDMVWGCVRFSYSPGPLWEAGCIWWMPGIEVHCWCPPKGSFFSHI